jgi:NAD(P)-dependent dehydrogenase (short-subunit alcohol dehydrogenase family)
MKLKDKVFVLTGGAGLLGAEFSRAVASEGGVPIIADIDLEKASNLSKEIKGSFPIKLDINSKVSIELAIELLHKKFGRIDGLVNNAYPRNQNYGKPFLEVHYEDFCENLNLNLGGYFLTSQCFIKYFVTQGGGGIINISSIYGVIAPRFEIYNNTKITMPIEYAAIKSGLIHLTKYMAKYTAGKNIKVNSLSPGGILDSQPEVFLEQYNKHCLNKGMLDPTDLCGTLIFLLSSDSEFINGQNIIVDDGYTL